MNQLSLRKNKLLFFVLIVSALIFFSGCSKGGKIINQGWMTENLNVDHYRNGDPIPEVKDLVEWSKLKTGAWCYYQNDQENGKKYGKLYNWYAVNDPRGLAPKGLHVPTKKEFEKLIETVHRDGNALKAVGQGIEAGVGTNTSGFSALLAGCRYISGYFTGLGWDTEFWSSSEYDTIGAYHMGMVTPCNAVGIDMTSYGSRKGTGLSVRCIKDRP
jgi:uncharacterized protein (TIGR02145 family)